MSHFYGIVFGHENNLDFVLAPFDENEQVDEYIFMTAGEALDWAKQRAADLKERYSDPENPNTHVGETLREYNNFESEEDLKNYIQNILLI